MNLDTVVNQIRNSNIIHLHMCQKNPQGYVTFTPNITDQVKNELKRISIDYLETKANIKQVEYNPTRTISGTVETVKFQDFDSVTEFFETFKEEAGIGEITPILIDFFIYEFEIQDKSIYLFRRHNKNKALRKGILGKILKGYYKSIETEDILTIDDKIDFLVYENEIIVFYHTAFERIFNLDAEFYDKAEIVLEADMFKNKIIGYDALKEDLLDNKNLVKRVSKLEGDIDKATMFLKHMRRTEAVINRFDLPISIIGDQICYEDKSQLGEIVLLMQDAYYRTFIGEEDGVDEGR
ncbi:Kiwa anti-phage protein KwaB-like domain-containing protein [Aerococcus sanguinicola]|uniref:DUF4868 domain-containing protein n=1 Tax=Aerococcus sanguinicola TaxID=119206 RepID=A0A0X8FBX8_9LACT|nr:MULTISPECIES: Kiwa anti-phage protein KwaB-like domain-containing protein [Aerococcus]AMB94520.1 hypothetical protein AWM72_07040 [Aerococcus sanguinicola]MDK7049399.1 DUF4868 domain-containing protein [Aerococcus sanguinicola]OFT95521.1 hypothetical protein HMPREF3090_04195 [Aerococcus sp. HMSC23C02]PKZ23484.1 DUF4868 domain-containing protein [Aerococcus sanguinicola]